MVSPEVKKRALELQAQGPDEFPFGFYLMMAREEIAAVPPRPDIHWENNSEGAHYAGPFCTEDCHE